MKITVYGNTSEREIRVTPFWLVITKRLGKRYLLSWSLRNNSRNKRHHRALV